MSTRQSECTINNEMTTSFYRSLSTIPAKLMTTGNAEQAHKQYTTLPTRYLKHFSLDHFVKCPFHKVSFCQLESAKEVELRLPT